MKKALFGLMLLMGVAAVPTPAKAWIRPIRPIVPVVPVVPVYPVVPVVPVVPVYRCQYVWNGWGWAYACY